MVVVAMDGLADTWRCVHSIRADGGHVFCVRACMRSFVASTSGTNCSSGHANAEAHYHNRACGGIGNGTEPLQTRRRVVLANVNLSHCERERMRHDRDVDALHCPSKQKKRWLRAGQRLHLPMRLLLVGHCDAESGRGASWRRVGESRERSDSASWRSFFWRLGDDTESRPLL